MYCSVWPSCTGLRSVTTQTHFFLHFMRNYHSGRWGSRNGFSGSCSKLAEVVRVARLLSRPAEMPEPGWSPVLGSRQPPADSWGCWSGMSSGPVRESLSCHLPARACMGWANAPVLEFQEGVICDLWGRERSGEGERPDKWSIWWVSGKELNAIPA